MKFTDKFDVGKYEIIHLYKLIQMYPAEKEVLRNHLLFRGRPTCQIFPKDVLL